MGDPDTSPAAGTSALTIAGADWFDGSGARAIFAALNREGHETRAVGGAVRNTLMGMPVKDVDFATTATPEEVTALAAKAGIRTVPTGLQHGTVTLVVDHRPHEVTTLRQDVETFGRHAAVAFTRDWAMDASRRDFTMNALYAGADGTVYDPLGGYPDLAARRVRFIGSARDRIREDYLRILRFFRFTADYGDAPDPEGFAASIAERGGLARLSAERVRAELLNILLARRPMRALQPMSEAGLLTAVLGGVVRLVHAERLIAIEAANGLEPDAVRRLGALALMTEEDATRLARRLRLSNAEAARLVAMAALSPVPTGKTGADELKTGLYRLGTEAYRDRVLIAWARSGADADDAGWREALTLAERWPVPVFPLRGQDLIAAGFEKGPVMGQMLRRLEEQWIASGFRLSRQELLDHLKN